MEEFLSDEQAYTDNRREKARTFEDKLMAKLELLIEGAEEGQSSLLYEERADEHGHLIPIYFPLSVLPFRARHRLGELMNVEEEAQWKRFRASGFPRLFLYRVERLFRHYVMCYWDKLFQYWPYACMWPGFNLNAANIAFPDTKNGLAWVVEELGGSENVLKDLM